MQRACMEEGVYLFLFRLDEHQLISTSNEQRYRGMEVEFF